MDFHNPSAPAVTFAVVSIDSPSWIFALASANGQLTYALIDRKSELKFATKTLSNCDRIFPRNAGKRECWISAQSDAKNPGRTFSVRYAIVCLYV